MVKSGFAQMAKGGLVMDVVNAKQAKIAEEAGVCVGTICFVFGQLTLAVLASTEGVSM